MSISIQHLTKTYGTQRAIDGISFTATPGEVLGFLGPNGAGKTTTMKIATCYLPPTDGTVTLTDGADTFNIFDHPTEMRRRIGYLPEHNPLYLDMYVHEFLDFAGRMHGLAADFRAQRVREVIEMTGLGREQHKKLSALSKGYRQRAGISQALIHNPSVLILDEPTTGLDPNQIVEIRNLIREVGKDKTVIFSSHILSEVEAVADRVVIINRGKIVADRATGDIRTLAQDEAIVHVEVANTGFDTTCIAAIEGVTAVEQITGTMFVIRSTASVEVRNTLFQACVAQNNPMLALQKEVFSLEDAFRKLTA